MSGRQSAAPGSSLDCRLVDQQGVRPILGRKACLGMRIVTYLDNDQLNKPMIKNAEVYTVGDETSFPNQRTVSSEISKCICRGIWLAGRRVPHPLRLPGQASTACPKAGACGI